MIDGSGTAVYLVSPQALVALRRDPATGALAEVAGPSGCIAARRRGGCVRARAYDDADQVLLPADGQNAYSVSDYSVGVFLRAGG